MMSREDIEETGKALADTAFERGDRLTAEGRIALDHWARWGEAGYPIRKLGREWVVDHKLCSKAGLFKRKRDAVQMWEIQLAKLRRLAALEAHQEAILRMQNFS